MDHVLANSSGCQELHLFEDEATQARGIIAIDSLRLGPAAGGCRLWQYKDHTAQAEDAIRLARGMSYKNALAGLPFGGGKAVLQLPSPPYDRKRIFQSFGDAVAKLAGTYVTAEDVGTTVADMAVVATRTRHVAGLRGPRGATTGDPSPWTARGVFECMRASADKVLGLSLDRLTVAVQGAGNVGAELCRLLAAEGASLFLTDIDLDRARKVGAEVGAEVLSPDDFLATDALVLAPCAMGAVFDVTTIPTIRARLICGGANNQLATPADGEELLARGIVYAPDYVVNAGGIISVAAEYLNESVDDVEARIEQLPLRLLKVLEGAFSSSRCPGVVADELAQQVIAAKTRLAA